MAKQYQRKRPGPPQQYIGLWREAAGLNARQLAELLGISEATQGRYERNELRVSLDYLEDCADALGICTAADLISRRPDEDADVAMAKAILARVPRH